MSKHASVGGYPDKRLVIDVLNEVAAAVAHDSTAEHPGDIAVAMFNAIEGAAVTIEVLWKRGVL